MSGCLICLLHLVLLLGRHAVERLILSCLYTNTVSDIMQQCAGSRRLYGAKGHSTVHAKLHVAFDTISALPLHVTMALGSHITLQLIAVTDHQHRFSILTRVISIIVYRVIGRQSCASWWVGWRQMTGRS